MRIMYDSPSLATAIEPVCLRHSTEPYAFATFGLQSLSRYTPDAQRLVPSPSDGHYGSGAKRQPHAVRHLYLCGQSGRQPQPHQHTPHPSDPPPPHPTMICINES